MPVRLPQFVLVLLWLIAGASHANNFYATPKLQAEAPAAFALQPQGRAFLENALPITHRDATALVDAIRDRPLLAKAIAQWPQLTMAERLPHLRTLFALEWQTLDITPPQLVIDNASYPGKTVYFDFDINNPTSGTVYLNPDKLAAMAPYASLAFLIHETRHSYQFQLAQQGQGALAAGYRAAFAAQKQLSGFSFSDFLTLLNEYEAFQFGNLVLGQLTRWQIRMPDMGTYASQFDEHGHLKIDLLALTEEDGPLIQQYNRLAKPHFERRQATR